ncbi:MAG: hypothetical protein AW09_002689 [Candidatus Accumulibacter phosphatis]|uniref:Uncharacterized protein n=1 Tax=Candidatus Accumulibacter phosphatis TaxID=327160 RepID=A0A080M506_9PROT|nr:MAG: hypothetical protein AW09_002689 [Candidatus Accumulibacter phosphatis]
MQDAVDPETHDADFASGLDMDVAGALVESILPEPVDNVDDMLVIGIELAIGTTEFYQLFERRQVAGRATELGSLLDRARKIVELDQITRDVDRVGDHPADFLLANRLDLLLPVPQKRLGRRHHDFTRRYLNRQHPEAGCVGTRHHFGHRSEIDLQGVDVLVLEANPARQPLAEIFESQWPMRLFLRLPFLIGNDHQRMGHQTLEATLLEQGIGVGRADQVIFKQALKDFRQRQAMFMNGVDGCLGHLQCSRRMCRYYRRIGNASSMENSTLPAQEILEGAPSPSTLKI